MNIRQKYRNFLRKLVDIKYLQKFKNAVVLGENIINGYYIVIFEDGFSEEEIIKCFTLEDI